MPDFNEDFLQFVWRNRLLRPAPLITNTGKEIFVIKPGDWNQDAGPDFFNAQIKIEELVLAGNIEIHLKTSDWLRHKHQYDRSYDNIILHVVYEHDLPLSQNIENNVEVLEVKELLSQDIIHQYRNILLNQKKLPCQSQLKLVDDSKFNMWLQRMGIERLEQKSQSILQLFQKNGGDYQQTFYTLLIRNFGFKVNAMPFEMLAGRLPLPLLLKHADNLVQIEALLLGAAGLLEQQFEHKHILLLQNEFAFLKNKYKIAPLDNKLFKFSKLRPANFATLRLAQMAKIIHLHPELFSGPQNYDSYAKIEGLLKTDLDGFWKNHYHPAGTATKKTLRLGEASIENIIVNTFANFFFFYYRRTGLEAFENISLSFLEHCAFEKNQKTKLFSPKKSSLRSALQSQALINLHDNYCSQKKCLHCGIAVNILGGNNSTKSNNVLQL